MLKNIPPIISPELMMILMEMGHGDEIVLAGANYLAESAGTLTIRADEHGIPELVEAILIFLPLDQHEEHKFSLWIPVRMLNHKYGKYMKIFSGI